MLPLRLISVLRNRKIRVLIKITKKWKLNKSKKAEKASHYEGLVIKEAPKIENKEDDKKNDTGIKSIKRVKKETQKFNEKTTEQKLKLLEKLHPF
jgi:hypothetical protein